MELTYQQAMLMLTGVNMHIDRIKNFISMYPQIYSDENTDKINEIKTNRKYIWICNKGHKFEALPSNIIKDDGFHCTVCSNHTVLQGYNDMATTHPECMKYLLNLEDGYKYTFGSNKKIYWKCPDCGYVMYKAPNKFLTNKNKCNNCNDFISYGEKYVSKFLDLMNTNYTKHVSFKWSGKKSYDFYLKDYMCIIEVHGKQHYIESGFTDLGGRTLKQEKANDDFKKDIASKNGIQHYIEINARNSDADYIKNSILQSNIETVLNQKITLSDEQWELCHVATCNNMLKTVCDIYENKTKSIKEISREVGYCRNTIVSWLKKGAKIGWCSYDSKEAVLKANKETSKRTVKTMSKPIFQMTKDLKIIGEYPSINEAQRKLHISHIWDVIVGRRQSAGGYIWGYQELDMN